MELAKESSPLFNGKTFEGWEGNLEFFRIEEGSIIAGRLSEDISHNEFLCTRQDYGEFELRLQIKGSQENVNGGIQIRSQRVPNSTEVSGYQADMGLIETEILRSIPDFISESAMREAGIGNQMMTNIWGALYDESRRNKILAVGQQDELAKIVKATDWNDFTIRCQGNRIQIWINGFKTVDYHELDDSIIQEGKICLQLHSGPPVQIFYRNILIRKLNPAEH